MPSSHIAVALIVIDVFISPSGMPSNSVSHLAEVRDRHADLADLAPGEDVVGVVAGLGREVERDRQPGLPLGRLVRYSSFDARADECPEYVRISHGRSATRGNSTIRSARSSHQPAVEIAVRFARRRRAAVAAAAKTTTRNGARRHTRTTATIRPAKRASIDRLRPSANVCVPIERGQQRDRQQLRDALDARVLEHARRNRQARELQRVAAERPEEHCGPHQRASRQPTTTATSAAHSTGMPTGTNGVSTSATAMAPIATIHVARDFIRGASSATNAADAAASRP